MRFITSILLAEGSKMISEFLSNPEGLNVVIFSVSILSCLRTVSHRCLFFFFLLNPLRNVGSRTLTLRGMSPAELDVSSSLANSWMSP